MLSTYSLDCRFSDGFSAAAVQFPEVGSANHATRSTGKKKGFFHHGATGKAVEALQHVHGKGGAAVAATAGSYHHQQRFFFALFAFHRPRISFYVFLSLSGAGEAAMLSMLLRVSRIRMFIAVVQAIGFVARINPFTW
jgi:hypothetical protein